MWEAWWHGDPYLNIRQYFRDTVFGRRTNDNASYDQAVSAVLEASREYPFLIIQTRARDAMRFERLAGRLRAKVETVALNDDENYIIAR
jgi:hypothetical protein